VLAGKSAIRLQVRRSDKPTSESTALLLLLLFSPLDVSCYPGQRRCPGEGRLGGHAHREQPDLHAARRKLRGYVSCVMFDVLKMLLGPVIVSDDLAQKTTRQTRVLPGLLC